jgi:hypothetical protein
MFSPRSEPDMEPKSSYLTKASQQCDLLRRGEITYVTARPPQLKSHGFIASRRFKSRQLEIGPVRQEQCLDQMATSEFSGLFSAVSAVDSSSWARSSRVCAS